MVEQQSNGVLYFFVTACVELVLDQKEASFNLFPKFFPECKRVQFLPHEHRSVTIPLSGHSGYFWKNFYSDNINTNNQIIFIDPHS